MKRRDFLRSTAALGSLALADTAPAAERSTAPLAAGTGPLAGAGPLVKGGVYQAGSLAQLFVDPLVVRQADNVSFALHPARKHPANPLVVADQPWEGWRLEIYGNVIFDRQEQLFKMWYFGESPDYFVGNAAFYATSADGIHWNKPLVGTIEARIPGKHNAVAAGTLEPNVFKDLNENDPALRYKMITYQWDGKSHAPDSPDQGYHTFVSPDGLHWTRHGEKRICPGADVITGYYDRQRKLWVALAKITDVPVAHGRRFFWLVTSPDFATWSEPRLVMHADARDDAGAMARIEEVRSLLDVPDAAELIHTEFYGAGFYQAESCVLAFPWIFTINNNARYGNQEGPSELQLAVTRDLEHWERPFRLACVERGAPDAWDPGFVVTQGEALRVGDEIWLYYGGGNYLHGTPCCYLPDDPKRKTVYTSSIGLAIWPLDRFVSVDGPAEGGRLTTVPLAFAGNRLELNVNTNRRGQSGSVRVELLDAAQKPLAGLGLSDEIKADAIRHTVTWSGNPDVAQWQGQPVSLRFHLAGAELFSFAFREAKA
ncbi:MAG TPA: hypothetical protein VHY91_23735 [Pirellulales bacterium]|jgi:hypothetical protein|nr:hypothetical protein [Pirellulales bacterium]